MSDAKKIFYTVAVSFAIGAAMGVLYAPEEGYETRRRLERLKRRLFSGCDDDLSEFDKETLRELSNSLQAELDKVNRRLDHQ